MSKLRGQDRQEFPLKVKKAAFARCCRQCVVKGVANQAGIPQCENCGNVLTPGNIEYEHLTADGLGGQPTLENCGVWCARPCSSKKTARVDNPRMAKADRVLKKSFGLRPSKSSMTGPGFRRPAPQRRASSPIEKWKGF